MDIITAIENKIAAVLASIDGTVQFSGYQFHTVTGAVDIDDESVVVAKDRTAGDTGRVSYLIDQSPDEVNVEWGDSICVLTNQITYRITARIQNTGKHAFPRRAIRTECNKVLADCKFAFANNSQLDGLVNWIKYDRAQRLFFDSGDIVRAANLEMYFQVDYGQQITNPDIVGNN